jgi:sugar/nucleoside kinase (ribokinase family)
MGPAVEISGGSAANTLVGLSALGGRGAFIGRVRNDQLGHAFRHDITAAGVVYDTTPAADGPATARCFVLVSPDGERTMNTYLGASVHLTSAHLDERLISTAKVLYLEGYLWDRPEAKAAFLAAAHMARKAGAQVALSLSDAFCVDRHRASFRKLVADEVDILFANETEILSLYETVHVDDALQAARRDCKLAALTRGAAGSVIVARDEVHVIDAVPVPQVVDTTGSGDLYAAGFLYGFTQGKPLASAGALGALAASEIISHTGARPQADLRALARQAGLL